VYVHDATLMAKTPFELSAAPEFPLTVLLNLYWSRMRISHRKRVDRLEIALSKHREGFRVFEHSRSISDASEKATNALLEMCHRWVSADRTLSVPRLAECCRSQKVSHRSPLFKKFKTIGDNASRLYEFSYNLPCRVDALYECAKLTDEVLKALIKERRIYRFISDSELKTVIQSVRKQPT
jgi:hypothetical protein